MQHGDTQGNPIRPAVGHEEELKTQMVEMKHILMRRIMQIAGAVYETPGSQIEDDTLHIWVDQGKSGANGHMVPIVPKTRATERACRSAREISASLVVSILAKAYQDGLVDAVGQMQAVLRNPGKREAQGSRKNRGNADVTEMQGRETNDC